jgi:hypothetical protein
MAKSKEACRSLIIARVLKDRRLHQRESRIGCRHIILVVKYCVNGCLKEWETDAAYG